MASSIQIGSFEKRAISSTKRMIASDLDEALPNRRFANWFKQIIGPRAGVVWQLTECGEQIGAPGEPAYDLPACVEITAMLPDWRKVFVAISVGTFKKGLTRKPAFFSAVVEQDETLYQIHRLSDLPSKLRAPERSFATRRENRIADPPAIKMDSARFRAPFRYMAAPSSIIPHGAASLLWSPTPAPPPRQDLERVPESVSQSRAIAKVKPVYPPSAKKLNATGRVEVEIAISEIGLVIEATAIGGHLALRNAAVEAARKWVFKPATLNGKPVRVKSVLTFFFAPSRN